MELKRPTFRGAGCGGSILPCGLASSLWVSWPPKYQSCVEDNRLEVERKSKYGCIFSPPEFAMGTVYPPLFKRHEVNWVRWVFHNSFSAKPKFSPIQPLSSSPNLVLDKTSREEVLTMGPAGPGYALWAFCERFFGSYIPGDALVFPSRRLRS